MKRASVFLAAALAAAGLVAQEKTAVVNMADLVRFHPSSERDRKLMQDTGKEFQAKLDKQRDRFDQLYKDYEKAVKEARNPALNDKAKAEAEDTAIKHRDVLSEAERDLNAESQKLRRELSDQETRLMRQIMGDIREVVNKFAQESKYAVVLDGTVLPYYDLKLDVTDDVLKRMGVDPKVRKEAKEKDAKEKEAKEKDAKASAEKK